MAVNHGTTAVRLAALLLSGCGVAAAPEQQFEYVRCTGPEWAAVVAHAHASGLPVRSDAVERVAFANWALANINDMLLGTTKGNDALPRAAVALVNAYAGGRCIVEEK